MRHYLNIAVLTLICHFAFGQCQRPSLNSFKSIALDGCVIEIKNYNDAGTPIEIVVAKSGMSIDEGSSFGLFNTTEYAITGLASGTSYRFWLRSVCSDQEASNFNGPYSFNTTINNDESCALELKLSDDNCESRDDIFFIDVDAEGLLGEDLVLNSMDLIIEHAFPADLKISLESPSGQKIVVSQFNGIQNDNYGVFDSTCTQFTRFENTACQDIKDASPPFIGTFRSEESFLLFNDNTPSQGQWKLRICDNASTDKGTLRYVSLNLTTSSCPMVEEFYMSEITDNKALVNWTPPKDCQNIIIEYGVVGFEPGTGTFIELDCANGMRVLDDLESNTDYQITLKSGCSDILSALSCPVFFNTKCGTPTQVFDFDQEDECTQACGVPCNVNTWLNVSNDDLDWIATSLPTNTQKTGPESAFGGIGKYLYLESNPAICGSGQEAILQSPCLRLISPTEECNMSFKYHMNGKDIGSLALLISLDNLLTFDTIWSKSGPQGDAWKEAFVDLSDFHNLLGQFRFAATTTNGDQGDIAIDHIEFFGSIIEIGQSVYYQDIDQDNYGNDNKTILSCSSIIPEGYTNIGGDCDDLNANINPDAEEIPCNLIDENCNGNDDDVIIDNALIINNVQLTNESCAGLRNGNIELEISGGTPPYVVDWNVDKVGAVINGLGEGIYIATVSDQNGCSYISKDIILGADKNIDVQQINIIKPSCLSIEDGSIEVISGDLNLDYLWSTGSTNSSLSNITDGIYTLTITNDEGCVYISDSLHIVSEKQLDIIEISNKNITCPDGDNGHIEILGSGSPSATYNYNWSNGSLESRINNLESGFYEATVTDAQGCAGIYSKLLTEPDSFFVEPISIEQVKCFGKKSGIVRTETKGGNPPYNYYWSNGTTFDILNGVGAGTYFLEVSDAKGCTTNLENIIVNEPNPLTTELSSLIPGSCILRSDGSIEVSVNGGTQPYNYLWRNGSSEDATLSNLKSGNYGIAVIDQNNCKSSIPNIQVPYGNQPSLLNLNIAEDVKCFGDQTGIIESEINGSLGPFDYNWSHGVQYISSDSVSMITDLESGSYELTITDAEGCVTISDPAILSSLTTIKYSVVSLSQNDCPYDSSGSIEINPSGGLAPYQFFWNEKEGAALIESLSNGGYKAKIIDQNNCIFETPIITIGSKSNINIILDVKNTSSEMDEGIISVTPFNGLAPYEITWDYNDSKDFNQTDLGVGDYHFSISDSLGCTLDSLAIISLSTSLFDHPEIQNIRLFPNPVDDFFVLDGLDSNYGTFYDIRIYNSQGQFIRQLKQPSINKSRFDVSDLKAGIYTLSILSSEKSESKLFIKI